jgi:hypothetical protein
MVDKAAAWERLWLGSGVMSGDWRRGSGFGIRYIDRRSHVSHIAR